MNYNPEKAVGGHVRTHRRLRKLAGIAAGILIGTAAYANPLASYYFGGYAGSAATGAIPETGTATFTEMGISVADLTRGPGVDPAYLAHGFSAQNWQATSVSDAIAQGEFFQFSISTAANYTMSLSSIDYRLRRSGADSPTGMEWQYSLDGFATAGTTVSTFTYNLVEGATGTQMDTVDLSLIGDLQDLGEGIEVTFRLFGWGGDGAESRTLAFGRSRTTGTPVELGDSLVIGGAVTAVPEPSVIAVILGGMTFVLVLVRRRRRDCC